MSLLDQLAGGPYAPLFMVGLFLAGSMLIVWRLNCMSARGVEGTVLGTLVMPYASGIGNLLFAVIMARQGGQGEEVVVNCLVNNVTNLTLLLGLPALIFGMMVVPEKGKKKELREGRINRFSLLLTLFAGAFFTGVLWALGRDGMLSVEDGVVLVGVFLFWQVIHVFEVMKANVSKGQKISAVILFDFTLIVVGGVVLYYSTDWIVSWLMETESGFISRRHIGWITGWLMVLPNALMAFYYAARRRADIVASSQVGDGHICIPLCIGLYCLFSPSDIPEFFVPAMIILFVATAFHFVLIAVLGRIPRSAGGVLVLSYLYFLWAGLV